MNRKQLSKVKDWSLAKFMETAGCLAFGALGILVLSLFIWGVLSLPITFGDTIAVLGIWAMFGALLGQNKMAGTSVRTYLTEG